jgi:hypothetical protein
MKKTAEGKVNIFVMKKRRNDYEELDGQQGARVSLQ